MEGINKTRFTISVVALIVCGSAPIKAASTQVDVFNLFGTAVQDNSGTALSVGDPVVNGDGFLFEVGYFTGDTATFTGTWVPITGSESNNPTVLSTIGDLSGQDGSTPVPVGSFSTSFIFDDSVPNTTNDLPAANAQLAIRFYDGTSSAGAMYNTVTSASSTWQFKALSGTPSPPFPNLDLTAGSLVWEDNANPFRTSLVPEPSTAAILGLGGLVMFLRRRR